MRSVEDMRSYVWHEDKLIGIFTEMTPVDLCEVFQVETVVNNGDHTVIRIKKEVK